MDSLEDHSDAGRATWATLLASDFPYWYFNEHADAGSVGHVADAASVGIHGSRTSNIGILIKLADAGSVGHGSGPGMSHREVITRGSLLHWYRPGKVHFVTYRLAGTLPIELIRRLRTERDERLARPTAPGVSYGKAKENAHKQFFAAYDKYLDQSLCVRWLEEPAVAEIVVENLYHHHQVKYQLLEYAVMPNHVHVLILPIESNAGGAGNLTDASSVGHVADAASVGSTTGECDSDFFSDETTDSKSPLSTIMHSLKSYTANEANKILERDGAFWQRESYDHWVRDVAELSRIAEYISHNPVAAKIVKNAWDWPYCSAYDRKHPRDKCLAEWW